MLCPRCYGKHVVRVGSGVVPCPECGGLGELHCCDGLREPDCGYAPVRAAAGPSRAGAAATAPAPFTHSPDEPT